MKKLFSLALALAMLLSMAVIVSAADAPASAKILTATQSLSTNDNTDLTLDGTLTLVFPLTADMFTWDTSTSYTGRVTSTHISRSGISAIVTDKTGAASSIESVRIAQKSGIPGVTGSTAAVEVKFRSNFAGTSTRSYGFTLYLRINGTRDYASETSVSGTLSPGAGNDIVDGDYIDISDGRTIMPISSARNVELYLGADVTVKRNLSANKRYSGTADFEISTSDRNLMDKYPSIDDIIVIRQMNLSGTGNYVTIDAGSSYFVYNADREYIGRSSSPLPFSSKYYLSSKQINMGAGSSSSASSAAPSSTTASSSSSGTISKTSAVSAAKSALGKSKNASVRYKDATSVAASTLQAMNDEAAKVSGKISLNADTMSNGRIMGRLSIPAASYDKLSSTVKLGVYTDSKNTSDVKSQFEKSFNNKIAVISMAHKGSFGASVTVIAKPNLKSFNTKTLYLYSYDKSGNKYRQLTNTGAAIDKNGYLNFKTSYGGEIIITDSPLKSK